MIILHTCVEWGTSHEDVSERKDVNQAEIDGKLICLTQIDMRVDMRVDMWDCVGLTLRLWYIIRLD